MTIHPHPWALRSRSLASPALGLLELSAIRVDLRVGYDAGSSTWCSVTTQSGGREVQEAGTYVYWWLMHVDVRQKLTQHCKTIILQLKKKFFFQKDVANTFQNCLMIRVRC